MMMATVAYFAHKNGWGGDVKFSASRIVRALIELAVVIVWPLVTWWLVDKAELPAQPVVLVRHGRRCSPATASSSGRRCCRS